MTRDATFQAFKLHFSAQQINTVRIPGGRGGLGRELTRTDKLEGL